VGTVWPFDNSFVALGLRKYGFEKEAAIVALGNLEATSGLSQSNHYQRFCF
jgi:glycogen debranching enzyme